MVSRTVLYGIAAVVIIAAAVIIFFYNTSSSNNLFVSLTDPANVPVGTQSLNITYSSLMVHTENSNGSAWISIPGTGTLDLLSLSNSSTLLGSIHVANGTVVNMFRFNVTSASIALNNTAYPVTLSTSQITVPVIGANNVNSTTNLLADLTPTVITVYTANSTLFIMVPTAKAIMIGNKVIRGRAVGSKESLSDAEQSHLQEATPNITVVGASLSSANNLSAISVQVKDNSNQSVMLRHVTVIGNQSVYSNRTSLLPQQTEDAIMRHYGTGLSSPMILNGETMHPIARTEAENSSNNSIGSSSDNSSNNVTTPPSEGELPEIEHEIRSFNFLVNFQGGIYAPSENDNFTESGFGYNLSAGQSVTLTFNGKLSLGNGNVLFSFVNGTSYNIVVQGDMGARASVNVTAS